MDNDTKPEATNENQEVANETVTPPAEPAVNEGTDKDKKATKPLLKRKWVIIAEVVLIVLIVLVILYLVLWQPKKTNTTTNQPQSTTGINNLTQLKAARDKLTNVVQPVTSSTSKLNSLK